MAPINRMNTHALEKANAKSQVITPRQGKAAETSLLASTAAPDQVTVKDPLGVNTPIVEPPVVKPEVPVTETDKPVTTTETKETSSVEKTAQDLMTVLQGMLALDAPAKEEAKPADKVADTGTAGPAEGTENAQGGKKGKGANKSGKKIPPGLAKKSAADLPDGNPWKAALEQREAEEAQVAADAKAKVEKEKADKEKAVEVEGQRKTLLTGMAALLSDLVKQLSAVKPADPAPAAPAPTPEPAAKPAAKPPANIAVGEPAPVQDKPVAEPPKAEQNTAVEGAAPDEKPAEK